jgi:hypothetical protein
MQRSCEGKRMVIMWDQLAEAQKVRPREKQGEMGRKNSQRPNFQGFSSKNRGNRWMVCVLGKSHACSMGRRQLRGARVDVGRGGYLLLYLSICPFFLLL